MKIRNRAVDAKLQKALWAVDALAKAQWKSVEKDNMEFEVRTTCFVRDAILEYAAEQAPVTDGGASRLVENVIDKIKCEVRAVRQNGYTQPVDVKFSVPELCALNKLLTVAAPQQAGTWKDAIVAVLRERPISEHSLEQFIEGAYTQRLTHNAALDIAEHIAGALTPPADSGWRTIDDGAPKDGTQILAYEKVGGGRYIAWWGGDPGRWRFFTINSVNGYLAWPEGYGPSHWQPLPAPPSRREREGKA